MKKKKSNRRSFLKKVVIAGSGSVAFVKAASASSAKSSLPAILSLVLDEENKIDQSVFNPVGSDRGQGIEIPFGANFMEVDARGAGGGGSSSIAFESTKFVAGGNGGEGGRARAVFDIRNDAPINNLGGTPVVEVGTGGKSDVRSPNVGGGITGGAGGQFGGGRGGNITIANSAENIGATAGAGGGGHAAITVEGNPIILAGGGGGAGGGTSDFETVFVGGDGGSGGAFQARAKRSGEDGSGLFSGTPFPALGGNRGQESAGDNHFFDTANSIGGLGANETEFLSGSNGSNSKGGAGATNSSESTSNAGGAGGGGGSGFRKGARGSGGGGGAGNSDITSGGGGAGGANYVDSAIAMPGFNDDAGAGAPGGRGGLVGEVSETTASERQGEAGSPAQVIVTFYRDNPNA